jgi:hypothetical protein
MTRYEQGFMSKCAEYGLGMDVTLALLTKMAAPGDHEAVLGSSGTAALSAAREGRARWASDLAARREASRIQAGKDIYTRGKWTLPSEQRAVDAYLASVRGGGSSAPAAAAPAAPAAAAAKPATAAAAPVAVADRPAPAGKFSANARKVNPNLYAPLNEEGVKLDMGGLDNMYASLDSMSGKPTADESLRHARDLVAWGNRLKSRTDNDRWIAGHRRAGQIPANSYTGTRPDRAVASGDAAPRSFGASPSRAEWIASGAGTGANPPIPDPAPVLASVAPAQARRRYLFGNDWAERHPRAVRNFTRQSTGLGRGKDSIWRFIPENPPPGATLSQYEDARESARRNNRKPFERRGGRNHH